MFSVKVRQFEEPLTVEMGQTILEAALAAGHDYPCGCRSGNCGACKSFLHSGEVEMSPYSEFALSAEEKAQGYVLACRSVPWSDCEVAYVEPEDAIAHPLRRLKCRVRELVDVTGDIRIVRLEVLDGGPFGFSAGQYARVTFDGLPQRDFSMANRPDEAAIEFHVRLTPGGRVSEYVTRRLTLGEEVRVEGPHGVAHLRERHAGPIVAVAGGSGLAPIKAIVETALTLGLRQPIALYFGVRDEADLYLEEHFTALEARYPNFRFVPVLSEPSGATARATGLMCEVLDKRLGDLDGHKAYLAGPPVMVETSVEVLRAHGIRREDCHADPFYTEAERVKLEASA